MWWRWKRGKGKTELAKEQSLHCLQMFAWGDARKKKQSWCRITRWLVRDRVRQRCLFTSCLSLNKTQLREQLPFNSTTATCSSSASSQVTLSTLFNPINMSGRGKGFVCCQTCFAQADASRLQWQRSRKRWCQASPQNSARQHPVRDSHSCFGGIVLTLLLKGYY